MRAGGVVAYIALGSNLGDREAALCGAVRALDALPDVALLSASRIYETEPVGPPGQGPYLNAVVSTRSWLAPLDLLARLQTIERRAGRDRRLETVRLGPRRLDLDLLLFGERCLESPELELPHPRMHMRAFLLTPLCEIVAPELRHPRTGVRLGQLAEELCDPEGVRPFAAVADWIRGDFGGARQAAASAIGTSADVRGRR